MTAREYLNQMFVLDREIHRKMQHIAALRTLLESDTPKLTGMPRNPSPNNSRTADIIAEIVDLEKETAVVVDRLARLRYEIIDLAYDLENDIERDIILNRYVRFKRWREICNELGFSKSHIMSVHNRALLHIVVPEKESTKQDQKSTE